MLTATIHVNVLPSNISFVHFAIFDLLYHLYIVQNSSFYFSSILAASLENQSTL